MSTGMPAKKETPVSQRAETASPEDELQERARKRVERTHGVKANIAAFLVGMIVLVPVWLLVEWQSAGGFKRWSEGGNPGDWDA